MEKKFGAKIRDVNFALRLSFSMSSLDRDGEEGGKGTQRRRSMAGGVVAAVHGDAAATVRKKVRVKKTKTRFVLRCEG